MFPFGDPYLKRLRRATVGGWSLPLDDGVELLREVLNRRRLNYNDAGEGRSRWWHVHLLALTEQPVSFVFYRRPWSRTYLAVDDFPSSAEPLVDSIVLHFEQALERTLATRHALRPVGSTEE